MTDAKYLDFEQGQVTIFARCAKCPAVQEFIYCEDKTPAVLLTDMGWVGIKDQAITIWHCPAHSLKLQWLTCDATDKARVCLVTDQNGIRVHWLVAIRTDAGAVNMWNCYVNGQWVVNAFGWDEAQKKLVAICQQEITK
jgi:hypothetical protein